VGPEVTPAAQGVTPAAAGAVLVMLSELTTTSAKSVSPRLSVTVRPIVIDPALGAITIAVAVSAPTMAGAFVDGSTTDQA
jgi:hypothetical protein